MNNEVKSGIKTSGDRWLIERAITSRSENKESRIRRKDSVVLNKRWLMENFERIEEFILVT